MTGQGRPFNEKTDPYQSGSRTMLELCEEGRGGVERRSHHKPSALLLKLEASRGEFPRWAGVLRR